MPDAEALGAFPVPFDELTEAQLTAIDAAREIYVAAGGVLDAYELPFLVRHLAFHKWRPEKAKKMLVKTAEWRASTGANAVRAKLISGELRFAQFPSNLQMLSYVWFVADHGRTRNGNVATYSQIGSIPDPYVWLNGMSDEAFYELNWHFLEHQSVLADKESVEKRTLIRSSVVYDAHNCSGKQVSMRLVRRLNTILPVPDLYYPELVGETFVVNAPWVIHSLWGIVRHVLSREIQSRVIICGHERTPETMAKHIDAAQCPSYIFGVGEVPVMSREMADELGFSALSPQQIDALLVNQSEEPQRYRILHADAPRPAEAARRVVGEPSDAAGDPAGAVDAREDLEA